MQLKLELELGVNIERGSMDFIMEQLRYVASNHNKPMRSFKLGQLGFNFDDMVINNMNMNAVDNYMAMQSMMPPEMMSRRDHIEYNVHMNGYGIHYERPPSPVRRYGSPSINSFPDTTGRTFGDNMVRHIMIMHEHSGFDAMQLVVEEFNKLHNEIEHLKYVDRSSIPKSYVDGQVKQDESNLTELKAPEIDMENFMLIINSVQIKTDKNEG
jgi:hypothetical protein